MATTREWTAPGLVSRLAQKMAAEHRRRTLRGQLLTHEAHEAREIHTAGNLEDRHLIDDRRVGTIACWPCPEWAIRRRIAWLRNERALGPSPGPTISSAPITSSVLVGPPGSSRATVRLVRELTFVEAGRVGEWRAQPDAVVPGLAGAVARPLAVARCALDLPMATAGLFPGPFALGHEPADKILLANRLPDAPHVLVGVSDEGARHELLHRERRRVLEDHAALDELLVAQRA